jgi:predicted permease
MSYKISSAEQQKISQSTQTQNRAKEPDVEKSGRLSWLADLYQDVLYGLRTLRKAPGFTAAAVLSLALGIGATTAIFSVVDAVLLRPMPFKDASRIVEVWPLGASVTYETLSGWSSAADFLEPFEGRQPTNLTITGAGDPKMIDASYVTGGLMTFLGVRPEIGRLLLPDDGKPGQDHTVVLAHSLWKELNGGDPAVIGRTITLDNQEYQVVGVMPPNFGLPFGEDVWLPFSLTADSIAAHKLHPILITRLIPPISLAQAQLRMNMMAKRLAAERPRRQGWDGILVSMDGHRASGDTQRDLMILLGCVAFVLAISCVNTANLQLSQSVVRERDAAVKVALGASRRRLIRQSLTESILLGLGGGLCGVVLAWWMLRMMLQAMPSENTMVNVYPITLDRRVLLFAIGISCLTGVVFGLIPSLRASRVDVMEKLSGTGRSYSGTIGLRRLRSSIVVGQVALSFTLLAGTGLVIRSLRLLYGAPEGFKTQNLVVLNLVLPTKRYSTGARQFPLFAGIEERIAGTPGVLGATIASGAPPDVRLSEHGDLEVEGRARVQAAMNMDIPSTDIQPNYFQVFGVPLLQGRTFTELDGATDSGVVIINQTMARRYWPNSSSIGKRFRLGDSPQDWHTVVGVVGDVKEFDRQNRPSQLVLFEPMPTGKTTDTTWVSLIVRTAGNTADEIKAIKEAIWSQDKEISIDRIATYQELESRALSLPQFYAKLMAVFAGIALLLSTIGIYGVISYSTTLRTREIGIRMVLGAQANHVVTMVVREGILPAGLGVLLGIACSAFMTRLIAGFLYGVTPTDPTTFTAVSAIYLCVALVASLLPARRASHVDPLIALRCE